MKLLSLSIQGFGKFRNYTLELSEGLNVLYGQNEAGKSTLHAFIEGMFYGFIDGSKKKRTFLPEHAKYAPRDNTAYQGSMTFNHEEKRYRLERNFDKKKGFVRLFNAKTGEDITDNFDTHPIRREIDLEAFFDMPYALFKNTLSIAQLSAKTSSDAGSDLLRRLQNMKETKSETLSISKAIDSLEKRISAIGSEKAPTKPYAQTLDKLNSLKSEYDQVKTLHEDTLNDKQSLDSLKEEDAHLENEKASLKRSLSALENTKRLLTYESVQKALNSLQNSLEEVSDNAPSVTETFLSSLHSTHKDAFSTLETSKDAVLDKRSKLESVNERLNNLNPLINTTPFHKIKDDYDRLRTLRDKRTESQNALKEKTVLKEEKEEAFEASRDKLHQRVNTFTHKWPFWSMLTIAAAFAGKFVLNIEWALWLLLLPVISGAILFRRNRSEAKRATEKLKTFDEAADALEKEKNTLNMATDAILKLTEKYGLEQDKDFEDLFYEAKNAREDQAKKETLEKNLESLLKAYRPLLKAVNLPTEHTRLKASFNALKEIKDTTTYIQNLLSGTPLDTLKRQIDFQQDQVDPSKEKDILKALEEIKDTLHAHAVEISKKEAAIANKEENARELSTIKYDLEATRRHLDALERNKRILSGAIDRLKTVQKDIEEHFAPIMNDNTKKYLDILTGSHYDFIRIKKDLSFKALSKETNQLESEFFFSKGTLDQIYIAMRFGILATLGKKNYPVFLDDAFVQFDEPRLKSALDLLNTMSGERQILLFTCHTRETDRLKEKGIPFKGHTLR